MRKCEYCGHQNSDDMSHCASCGTEFLVPTARLPDFEPRPLNLKERLRMCCGMYPKEWPRRAPRCAFVVLAAPFVSFVVAGMIVRNAFRDPHDGLAAYAFFVLILFLGMMVGGLTSLIGLARAERYRGLGWLGLLMNFGPVLFFFVYDWTHR